MMKTKKNDVLNEAPSILFPDVSARAGEGQCDCACVATVPVEQLETAVSTSSRQAISTTIPYILQRPFSTVAVAPQHHAVITDYTTSVILNETALNMAHFFKQAHTLPEIPSEWTVAWGETAVHDTLQQMVVQQILVPAYTLPALTEVATTLSAWLHITDRCNLRCDYCYLPHKREDLSLENGRAAIAATFRSAVKHQYQRVKLKYAGGEPFIRFDLVAELHQYAQLLAQEYQLDLDGVVLSNGTLLTIDYITAMQAMGLRLMISLDGIADAHDQQRHYANGRGSFNDVARNIELALASGLIPDISVTVSGRNAHELPVLMRWILAHDLPFSLNFYRENELSASFADLQLEETQIIEGMQSAFAEIESNMPSRSLLSSLVDRANLATSHQRTCGVGHSYLVFDQHGQASQCQMHQGQPITDVHAEDPLALIRADQVGIQNLPVQEKEGCRDCEWRNWCTGGCPLATYRATGRYDVQSPNCHIYKALYPEAVRLEGLRLLQNESVLATGVPFANYAILERADCDCACADDCACSDCAC